MHIACATVQHVKMTKLCEIVERAAEKALVDYNEARKLRDRGKKNDPVGITVISRQYADLHFLTRLQQFDRTQWWNSPSAAAPAAPAAPSAGGVVTVVVAPAAPLRLRQCFEVDKGQDQIEFNWGYETPDRERNYTEYDTKWDQIDVRMHFFHERMKHTEWKKAADCMWFIQDYVDFMRMLQHLDVYTDTESRNNKFTELESDRLPNYVDTNSKLPPIVMLITVHVTVSACCRGFSTAEMQVRANTGGRTGCSNTLGRKSLKKNLVNSRSLPILSSCLTHSGNIFKTHGSKSFCFLRRTSAIL